MYNCLVSNHPDNSSERKLLHVSLCTLSAVLALLDEILAPDADIHHDPVLVGSHPPEHPWFRLHGRAEWLGGLRATAAG